MTEEIASANNVFFQRHITEEYIKGLCKRAVDMIPAVQESKETGRIGRVVVALRPDEIAQIVEDVQKSQGLVVVGNDLVRLAGTSILMSAVIIETV